MWRIEPVPSRRRWEALQFIAGAGAAGPSGPERLPSTGTRRASLPCAGPGDPSREARAAALFALAEGPPRASLWWAWDGRCVAAAMIVTQPGRTGFLFLPPAEGPGVEPLAMAEAVQAATREAADKGLFFIQVSMPAAAPPSNQPAAWGYELVAELIYMNLDLPYAGPRLAGEELSWRGYGRSHSPFGFAEAELGELILATYEGSLDCPSLLRLRGAKDILASHRASGQFRPESWWIVDVRGSPAGCALVNDRPMESAAEVVYLGVRPEQRGKGLALRLLERAASDAQCRGLGKLLLAVDARNAPALAAYGRAGFRPTHRRHVWAFIPPGC